ncbi:hypothetical protein MTP99_001150 [Tenebrio molitor]|nr:hypothetical protein MTP99_001150 [Tenebrio molitor]
MSMHFTDRPQETSFPVHSKILQELFQNKVQQRSFTPVKSVFELFGGLRSSFLQRPFASAPFSVVEQASNVIRQNSSRRSSHRTGQNGRQNSEGVLVVGQAEFVEVNCRAKAFKM